MTRTGLSLVAVGVLAVSVAGCGASSSKTGGAPNGGLTSATGGVIKVGVAQLPPGKGDPYKGIGSPQVYTLAAIFDTLTQVGTDGKVVPQLATSWKSATPTTWQFTLRPGVKFSDGETLDANAVTAAFNYLLTDPNGKQSVVNPDIKTISAAKALDAATVEFSTSSPDPILPNQVSEVYIPAPQKFASEGAKGFANDPVGSGPFTVASWTANKIGLKPFKGSWRPPQASGMEINALPDPAARLQALQSGQINLAIQLSPDQATQLRSGAQATAVIQPAPQVMSLAFINTLGGSPLKDQRVRVALNYAVDKQAMANNLLLGKGKPAGQGATPEAFGYNPSLDAYPHDPQKAKQLLAEAGYPTGFTLSAMLTVGSYPADSQIYQLMQQNLADVGVKLKPQTITFPAWLGHYIKNNWPVQSFGLSWNTAPVLDAQRPMGLFSCLKKPAFFCDQAVVPVLNAAAKELDTSKRRQLLQQAAQIEHADPPSLFLVQQIDINGIGVKLQGFQDVNRIFPYDKMAVG